MKITEKKEVVRTQIEETIVKRKCDICNKDIKIDESIRCYNYFKIHTWHDDWGNDSIESNEYFDACCPECAIRFTERYIKAAFMYGINSRQIEIKHARSL